MNTINPPSPMADSNSANYVEISIPDERVKRWRVLFNWLLAIPHWLYVIVLGVVSFVLWILLVMVVLFTGKIPQFYYRFLFGLTRYVNKVWGYSSFYFQEYPSFRFMLDDPVDKDDYSIRTHFYAKPGKVTRWRVFRPILAIPHYILSYFLDIASFALGIAAALYALVTRRYPDPLRNIQEVLATYSLRVNVYAGMVGDKYPRLG